MRAIFFTFHCFALNARGTSKAAEKTLENRNGKKLVQAHASSPKEMRKKKSRTTSKKA